MRRGFGVFLGGLLLFCAVPVCTVQSTARAQAGSAPMIVDGDFEQDAASKALRSPEKPRGWFESRGDSKLGRVQLLLSSKKIGGDATKKAMIKGGAKANTYLSQALREPQKGPFSLQWDIYVKSIASPGNRSAFQMIGNDSAKGHGPNATGTERFVFLAFEPASTAGKINLVAMEDAGASGALKSRVIVPDLALKKWHTVRVECNPADKSYTVFVLGATASPVAVKAFVPKDKPVITELTHLSFASWNDGPGVFYVDNVK
jgi:hypothetical protein